MRYDNKNRIKRANITKTYPYLEKKGTDSCSLLKPNAITDKRNTDEKARNPMNWYHKVPVVFYFSQGWYFIDIYDSWSVTQKIIELPIRYVDDIQRNGIHIIHFQNMYFLYQTKKRKSLLFRILFISYHLKNHQNFIGVITKEYSISRLLFVSTYNVSKLWYWVVEEHKWSLYFHFDWVLTKQIG